jgi:hypothetical protein
MAMLGVSYVAHADTIHRAISLSATVASSTSDFSVTDVSNSWPTTPTDFVYDETGGKFNNPSPLRIKVKSTADVSLSTTTPPKLVNGLAEIPVTVMITQVTTAGSATASRITVTAAPQTIYTYATETGAVSQYDIDFDADELSMLGADGMTTSTPADGNYAGTVNLLFESNI